MINQRKTKDAINHLVDIIWFIDEHSQSTKIDLIIPTGHIHIIYNLADSYFLLEEDDCLKLPNQLLVGQFKQAMNLSYGQHVKQLGIAIRPSAYFKLFGQYSGFLTNTIIECHELDYLKELHHYIADALIETDIEKIFDLIEDYFNKYASIEEDSIDDMLAYIDDRKGLIDVQKMSKHFGYSQSSMERLFKKHFGLTPKAHSDIIRFRFAMLEDDPTCLYYDQPHFIKACKRYTRKAPTSLLESVELTLKDILGLK